MNSFQVLITPDAENDLIELGKYIAQELLSPHVARDYLRFLRAEIGKLSYLATGLAPIPDEPWHSRGIRCIAAKNFLIYYRIDTDSNCVYVLNVIYGKRDQLAALRKADETG